MRLPKHGETWKFPSGVMLTFQEASALWLGSDGTAWNDLDMEALARNGAIVPVGPEVYEGEYTCQEGGSWYTGAAGFEKLFHPLEFRAKEGDIVKWRIEVVRA